jgi:hypothetical protein
MFPECTRWPHPIVVLPAGPSWFIECSAELLISLDQIDAPLARAHAARSTEGREGVDGGIAAFYQPGLSETVRAGIRLLPQESRCQLDRLFF